ncbi:murein DD-endopeptidase MepM/ murein hydrolase activator NlpD [Pseudosporangium ferrugineum]|uniref:Murein DD-endopeptidase MepM/ murein hydrolase activator NlpD n=2 Tax=Pseudosporangium ferrugineum TaxID=439699 RepID=A0A2T0S3F3_9ACTN|nr:murein DD-endopeptidase MepM/ murein hydrolase activator NlpD [Pseudosporangium ferrugineum]
MAACLSVLCCAGLAATAAPASAGPAGGDDARRAARAVDRAEAILEHATVTARNAARRLEAATAALPAAQKKVATARGVVAAASVQAATARRKADTARELYGTTAAAFDAAQVRVEKAYDRVDEIAAASYMGGNFATINVLIGARGPQDAMDRLGLVDQVMRGQQEDVDELTRARRLARVEQDRAGLAKRAAEEAEREAAGKLRAARNAQVAAQRARAAVIRLAESRKSALHLARSQRAAVLAKYEQAKAEEARIQNALRGWDDKNGGGSPYVGGKLLMPVHGWKTSDYGSRYDPYYHVWQLHAGTDIAAGGGTPIHAAASGQVIRAGWNGGYGKYTCIAHGKKAGRSFSTCYGHQSRINVRPGEYVRRGEVIGRVGTTGASTGYHLHFETRFDGVPKNPLNYLPSCLC